MGGTPSLQLDVDGELDVKVEGMLTCDNVDRTFPCDKVSCCKFSAINFLL